MRVSQYQNVSILNFTGVKDDGGGADNWSYKMCKVPIVSSPSISNVNKASTIKTKANAKAMATRPRPRPHTPKAMA